MTLPSRSDIAAAAEAWMRHRGTGPLAELRRMTPERVAPAAWHLIAAHEIAPDRRAAWCEVFRLMALMIPRGDPTLREPVRMRLDLGRALADGGVADWNPERDAEGAPIPVFSQSRMQQLLAARGAARLDLLGRACLMLSRSLDPGRGIKPDDLARAVLAPDDTDFLAYPYYRRLVPGAHATTAAAKETDA